MSKTDSLYFEFYYEFCVNGFTLHIDTSLIQMQDVSSVDPAHGEGRKGIRREANKGTVRSTFSRYEINSVTCG